MSEMGLPAELPAPEEGLLLPQIARAHWWSRLIAWVGSQFAPRPYTAEESFLHSRCGQLAEELSRVNQKLAAVEVELRKANGTIKVQELYILNLVDVNDRDRQRVKAEKAEYMLHQAMAKTGIEKISPPTV